MNSSIKKILGIVLLISFGNVFAAVATCPPVDTIRNVKFIQARSLTPELWLLSSDSFDHAGVAWNVWTEVKVDARTAAEALTQGQKHFSVLPLINDPEPVGKDQAITCVYNEEHAVLAISPPFRQPPQH